MVALAGVTDAYQPVERRTRITRRCLEVFAEFRNPVAVVTKSALVLRDVAMDIGMHESTVSRVTTGKYMHTPQGIFELKFFFHSELKSRFGESTSSISVKDQIRRLVADEDTQRPLTDQRIVELLRARNIEIARRTVTKYRKELKILSASKRKRVPF